MKRKPIQFHEGQSGKLYCPDCVGAAKEKTRPLTKKELNARMAKADVECVRGCTSLGWL